VIETRIRHAARVLYAATIIGVCACTPVANDTTTESASNAAQSTTPLYISSKQVSTDCGVDAIPDPPPGFAHRPGAEIVEMPKRLADFQAVGAERPLAETDPERVSPGYVLIEPGYRKPMFLVNNDKEIVATVENDYFSYTQFLADGSSLASSVMYSDVFRKGGGYRGCVEEYRPDGSLNWRLALATDNYVHHHDVVKLENGNVLAVVWERVPSDLAVELGRNPEHVAENGDFWFDGIVEVNPNTARIVWEWSARHHLIQDFDPGKANYGVVADHPERLDINAIRFNRDGSVSDDWTHVNALDYNAELDQIIFSSNYLSEIFVIDHSTTPFESQRSSGGRYGKGGDLLYRWGNPAYYDRGTEDDRTLFNQHDVQWIDARLPGAGNILIFNNGDGRLRPHSSVIELALPMNADGSYILNGDEPYGPTELIWEYAPTDEEIFFSFFISGAQRLANGNTLVNQGAGARVREVTPDGDIVWEYVYDDGAEGPHMLFRAIRYPADHPAVVAIMARGSQN
jgi:hypothetical protein